MLRRVFRSIRILSQTDFRAYYSRLQRSGSWAGPTVDEAKVDYVRALRAGQIGGVVA